MKGVIMEQKCTEGETVGFAEGLEQIDSVVRTVSSMLNRFNRAMIFIGVDKAGIPLGKTFSEEDFPLIDGRFREKLNRLPEYSLALGS